MLSLPIATGEAELFRGLSWWAACDEPADVLVVTHAAEDQEDEADVEVIAPKKKKKPRDNSVRGEPRPSQAAPAAAALTGCPQGGRPPSQARRPR